MDTLIPSVVSNTRLMKRKKKGEAKKRTRKSHKISQFERTHSSKRYSCVFFKRGCVSLRRDDLEKWTETVIFIRFVPRSILPPNGSYTTENLTRVSASDSCGFRPV